MEPPNLRQPFSIDPRARRLQHRRRNIDAGHKHVAREKRQFEPGADADNEDLAVLVGRVHLDSMKLSREAFERHIVAHKCTF